MSLCQIYSLACELGTIPGPDISLFQSSVMHVHYYIYNIKISFHYFKRKTKNKTVYTTKYKAYNLEESQKMKKKIKNLYSYIS